MLRTVSPLSRALASVSIGSGAVAVVLAGAHLHRSRVLDSLGGVLDSEGFPSSVRSADSLVNAASVALVVLAIAEFALLVTWTWRMAVNVRAVGHPARMGNGFAVGGFFIPIANIVIPFLFFRDFVRSLDRWSGIDQRRYTVMIWWWWLQIGALFFSTAPDEPRTVANIADYVAADQSFAAGRLVFAASAVFGAMTFRRFARDAFPGA